MYTMKYYSAIKRNKVESFVVMWIDLDSVIQRSKSEGRHRPFNLHCVLTILRILGSKKHICQRTKGGLGTSGKEPTWRCRRCRRCEFDSESGRSSGEGNGNPLQYSCLGNPTDRGAWLAAVHRVAKSRTQLKQLSTHTMNKNCGTSHKA